jgi:hypothetical protein
VVGLVGRVLAEQQIQGMQNGFGRMNGDLWPCVQQGEGKPLATISARFPESDWRQLNVRMAAYLHPGPGGALPTTRYELIVEGLQECEARIFIQNALLDEAQAAKLGSERVARLQELLDERTRALLRNVYEFGWQDRSAKLYAAAAEVAGIVK